MDILLLILGFLTLIIGGDFLVKGAVALAVRLKVSLVIIGLTVVSFATSAPELIVSVYAALKGHPDIALGNVIGSNIANLSLVLGATAIFFPMLFDRRLYRFDIPVMLIVSILFGFFLKSDSVLTFWEGLCLFVVLIIFILYSLISSRNDKTKYDVNHTHLPVVKLFFFLVFGSICLYFGTQWLVNGATGIAREVGVTERVISVSVVAFGTSVPELAASVIAAMKREKGLSVGNLIGSNIFNILAVMGITSMIHPVKVSDFGLLTNDFFWMIGVAFLLYPLMYFFTKKQIGALEGLVLFILYITYILLLF